MSASKFQVGKTYLDGWGKRHHLAGLVKGRTDVAWSIQGNWFRLKDGRMMTGVAPDAVLFHPRKVKCNYDLSTEIETPHYWKDLTLPK